MSAVEELNQYFQYNNNLFVDHPWPDDATQWTEIYNDLKDLVATARLGDILAMKISYQARLLNLAFSNENIFELLEPVIAPIWNDTDNTPHLMNMIWGCSGDDLDPNSQGLLPFVLQKKALDIPQIVSALKMYPNAFSRVFTSRPQPIFLSGIIQRWMELGLATEVDIGSWAVVYDQKEHLQNINISPNSWETILKDQSHTYFLNRILDVCGYNDQTAWAVVSNHLPPYDRYEDGFGDWNTGFCKKLFESIKWDAEKTHTVFEKTVAHCETLDIGHQIEHLYECFPPEFHHLLHPYLLMFDFSRSKKMQEVTEEAKSQKQNATIFECIAPTPTVRTTRKL